MCLEHEQCWVKEKEFSTLQYPSSKDAVKNKKEKY